MEEKRERPYVTGGGRMGKLLFFPSSFLLPLSPTTQSQTHTHTLPYLMPASIPADTQQNTTMRLTLYASPAILGVAATSPKMAPSERAQRYSNDPTGPLSARWHERRIPRWQCRWHEKLLGTKKKKKKSRGKGGVGGGNSGPTDSSCRFCFNYCASLFSGVLDLIVLGL